MKLQPTESFSKSLSLQIQIWKSTYGFTDTAVKSYTHKIYQSLQTLATFPRIGKSVNAYTYFYHDTKNTRVYIINHAYSVFYRIHNNTIWLGMMYSQKQNPDSLHY